MFRERSMNAIHTVLNVLTALVSLAAAVCWVKSATSKVLSPDTQGWGALIGGFVIVRGPNDERIDLAESVKLQSIWNQRAAIITAIAAVLVV
jgi:hypothetical protein